MSERSEGPVRAILEGRPRDLGGGLLVRRVLPQVARRHVGPFVFLDHFGPRTFGPGEAPDVRPHPHIGLATVTWLFEGAMVHRDSLGSHQTIMPGELNWMTAGRGIAHSERSRAEDRVTGGRAHGLQLWVALPDEHEEAEPSFDHYAATDLPGAMVGGASVRLLVGAGFGVASPVRTFSPTFYAEVALPEGASIEVPAEYAEMGAYVVEGAVRCGAQPLAVGQLAVLAPGAVLSAIEPSRLALLGGEPVGERHIWWNFVSSRKDRISEAAEQWRERRFPAIPGDDVEFIPLP